MLECTSKFAEKPQSKLSAAQPVFLAAKASKARDRRQNTHSKTPSHRWRTTIRKGEDLEKQFQDYQNCPTCFLDFADRWSRPLRKANDYHNALCDRANFACHRAVKKKKTGSQTNPLSSPKKKAWAIFAARNNLSFSAVNSVRSRTVNFSVICNKGETIADFQIVLVAHRIARPETRRPHRRRNTNGSLWGLNLVRAVQATAIINVRLGHQAELCRRSCCVTSRLGLRTGAPLSCIPFVFEGDMALDALGVRRRPRPFSMPCTHLVISSDLTEDAELQKRVQHLSIRD